MRFQDVHWLTFVCLLSTGLTSPVIPDIEHGLISLTDHLNTTNLTLPICTPPDPGYEPTLIDCTTAVNTFRFVRDAHEPRFWTAGAAIGFRARWRSCQVHLRPVIWYSEDVFALTDLADVAFGIILGCVQRETGTTLGGFDVVGEDAVFRVFVSYVEPNQTGNMG